MKGPPLGYRDKQIRLEFPDLADDCHVTIKNPKLQPIHRLLRDDTPDGDYDAARAASNKVRAGLVVDWCVWDVDTDEQLPGPPVDPAVFDRIPSAVVYAIQAEIDKAFPH